MSDFHKLSFEISLLLQELLVTCVNLVTYESGPACPLLTHFHMNGALAFSDMWYVVR